MIISKRKTSMKGYVTLSIQFPATTKVIYSAINRLCPQADYIKQVFITLTSQPLNFGQFVIWVEFWILKREPKKKMPWAFTTFCRGRFQGKDFTQT